MAKFNAEIVCENGMIEGIIDESSLIPKYYDDLLSRPSINGVVLTGDRNGKDYGLVDQLDEVTNFEIENIFK